MILDIQRHKSSTTISCRRDTIVSLPVIAVCDYCAEEITITEEELY